MSLFGDDNDHLSPSPHRPTNSKNLFGADDDQTTPTRKPQGTSLFTDAQQGDSDDWGFTPATKKRTARSTLVKSLLSEDDVPKVYIEFFHMVEANGPITESILKHVLNESKIEADVAEEIIGTVATSNNIGEGEVYVFLALTGLAQEGDEVTLDGVDERRRNLPIPNLGSYMPTKLKSQPTSHTSSAANTLKRSNVTNLSDSDPWASPDMHKGHNHTTPSTISGSNGDNRHKMIIPDGPVRTTSAYTASSSTGVEDIPTVSPPDHQPTGGSSWAGFGQSSAPSIEQSEFDGGLGGGFGHPSMIHPANDPIGLGAPLPRIVSGGPEEVITITTLSEKEGMFLFQHRNYQVSSSRRNSKVIRRYSDFTWLLDCLHKRFPYRQLPLLPPKRVAINGNYIATDVSFIEKRRRGLARFSNALVRHPILSQDQLVVMFLTVPTELSVWRKQASFTINDEFLGKALPATLEEDLPADLPQLFDRVRGGVRRSAEQYIALVASMERMLRRNEGVAAEYTRVTTALQQLVAVTGDAYALTASGSADVGLLTTGLAASARHVEGARQLAIDEARAWEEGVLEDLRRARDTLVGVRDIFERRDRNEKDTIPGLEKRIRSNEEKLKIVRAKAEAKPGEAEKISDAITKDKQAIVDQHARTILIKECLRDEIGYFHASQFQVSRLHQDWAAERVKYAELYADNWRTLADEVESMPLGD